MPLNFDKICQTNNRKVFKWAKNRVADLGKMKFCPKCGTLLVQKRTRFVCPKCGYVEKGKVKLVTSEKFARKEGGGVLKEKKSIVMPIIKITCPKCGNEEAYFYTAQTRAGDEAETQFFQCTKCKHRWRKYT